MSRRDPWVFGQRGAVAAAVLSYLFLGQIAVPVASAGTAGSTLTAPIGQASARELLPLSAVRPGMTGHGLTVFSGTRPERFVVRVIGVLRQFQPQLDIILIQSDDERLKHSGIAAGMSGSPIYLEGKLAGALAYGWSFAKDPIAGVTPIESIVRELRRPSRAVQSPPQSRIELQDPGRTAQPSVDQALRRALLRDPRAPVAGHVLGGVLPAIAAADSASSGSRLLPVALPLSVAGLGPRAIEDLRVLLSPLGLVPLQATGGGAAAQPTSDEGFVEGGAIAVQLARGDVSMTGTGTVTYIEGSRVAAFGHPMLGVGEVHMPVATAEVLTFLASQSMSFKMSMPRVEQGALLQDRPSCIVADTRARAPVLPLDVRVRIASPGTSGIPQALAAGVGPPASDPLIDKSFHIELAQHRMLTPLLLSVVSSNAVQTVVPDVTEALVEIRSRIRLRGFPAIEHRDVLYSTEGLTSKMLTNSTGVRQLQELFNNPFGPVQIEGMELGIGVNFRAAAAEIIGISLPGDELDADTRPSLNVTLRPYAGTPYVRSVPIDVPRWLAGQALKIEVQAGHQVKPELAPPENLRDFVDNLRTVYSASTLVVTLNTLEEGVTLRGRLVPALPASVIATLRPAGGSRRGEPYKRVGRQLVELDTVLSGKQELTVLVRDEVR